MIVNDEELQKLNYEKQTLLRQVDRHDIDKAQFNRRIRPIEDKINIMIKGILNNEKQKQKQTEEGEIKMSEDEQPKKIGRKQRANSNASIITKVLMKKSVTTIEQALSEFDLIKPGNDPKNTKTQIKGVIRHVKKGTGPWAKYSWNEEKYQLTLNE